MLIALVGDIHSHRTLVAPWRMFNKRLLGVLNLLLNRRSMFDHNLIQATFERVASIKPDAVLLSGDFTSTALPEEFDIVARVIRQTIGNIPTFAVPGNHDRYTRESVRRRTMERWMGDWMPPEFPHLQLLSRRWRLLLLNAAIPSSLRANGRLGEPQLRRAAELIAPLTAAEGLVTLCHYPLLIVPGIRSQAGHRLRDLAELQRLLASCPAEHLYLHGHVHQPWLTRPAPTDPLADRLVDINAGSPTMRTENFPAGQGFWELNLPDAAGTPPLFRRHEPSDRDAKSWKIVAD